VDLSSIRVLKPFSLKPGQIAIMAFLDDVGGRALDRRVHRTRSAKARMEAFLALISGR